MRYQSSCRADIGVCGFFSRCHLAVTPPFVFESILGVPVESVQGNQAYLEWMGKLGSFQIEVRLPGMCSSFKVRPASS